MDNSETIFTRRGFLHISAVSAVSCAVFRKGMRHNDFPWKEENRNPGSDTSIYLIPNTHVAEDMQRDSILLEQLVKYDIVDAVILEGLDRKKEDSPYSLEDLTRFGGMYSQLMDNIQRNRNVGLFGCLDKEAYNGITNELYLNYSKIFFSMYFGGLKLISDLESKLEDNGIDKVVGFPNETYSLEKFKNMFLPVYHEVKDEVSRILNKKVDDDFVMSFAEPSSGAISEEYSKLVEEKIHKLRDSMLYLAVQSATGNYNKKRIAIQYGKGHLQDHIKWFKGQGYNVYVAIQPEGDYDAVKEIITGKSFIPEKLSRILTQEYNIQEYALNYRGALTSALMRAMDLQINTLKDNLNKLAPGNMPISPSQSDTARIK